jgi:hypothetical protein
MLKTMRRDLEPQEIAELRAEAAEARSLAGTFRCDKTVRDLLNYASELDIQAAKLEQDSLQLLRVSSHQPTRLNA